MDVTSKQKKKIIKYIIDDRYKKLAKYLEKEEIELNAIINSKGEKMIHICAREGSTDSLEFLINKGAKVSLVDRMGNLALHLALEHLLANYSSTLEQNLLSQLLTYSSSLLNKQNYQGVSCKDLLNQLSLLKGPTESPTVNIDSDSDDREYSDKKWREKLEYECDHEFESNIGKYEADDTFYYSSGGGGVASESYDTWADRIYEAFSARQRRTYSSSNYDGKKKSVKPNIPVEGKPKSLKAEPSPITGESIEKLREKRKVQKIREMYAKLFSSSDEISSEDIPFTSSTPAEIIDIMLQDTKEEGGEVVKRTIREELRRWHPDKFKQKVGCRIRSGQLDQVMEKVKTIAQALTSFAK